MKIKEILKNRKNLIILICVVLAAVLLAAHTLLSSSVLSAGNGGETQETVSNVNPQYRSMPTTSTATVPPTTVDATRRTTAATSPTDKRAATAPQTTASAASRATTQGTTASQNATIPFATAIKPEHKADYAAQWNLGYLVAIDNPDTSYACAKVTLSDADRDLLERLCYGEFGSGGFVGAALIAQSVKDAMCFDGYASVKDVIKYCRYDGSTTSGTSEACRQAVRYIFDENHDAVQHRIMYMYNPYIVQSAFHESQNFILSYLGVRFFDRWGY